MDTEQSVTPTRPGTPGLDVFKIASRSISGFLHSFKTGENRQVRMPYTSTLELKLALYQVSDSSLVQVMPAPYRAL